MKKYFNKKKFWYEKFSVKKSSKKNYGQKKVQ